MGLKFVEPRIRYIIGAFIWFAFGFFFNYRVKSEMKKICPRGENYLIGGKRKRNLQTFDEDLKKVIMFNIFTILDETNIHLTQNYEEILGK